MADKIIILSGKQFCGKDTVAKILLEIFPDFRRIGLGDAIKLEYGEREGLSLEEIEKHKPLYRQDLIDLGNFRRSQDSDYWIKKVIALEGNIIVPDVRMKRELEFFKEAGAFKIRVECDRDNRAKRGVLKSENDRTETELDDVKDWDYVIENNSSYENLQTATKLLADNIKDWFPA